VSYSKNNGFSGPDTSTIEIVPGEAQGESFDLWKMVCKNLSPAAQAAVPPKRQVRPPPNEQKAMRQATVPGQALPSNPQIQSPSPLPNPASRAEALQIVNAAAKDCTFDDEGATHSDEDYDQKVAYSGLTISLSNSGRTTSTFGMAMWGGDTLEVRGDFQTGSSDRACWFFNKSYAAQRLQYDRVIAALRLLGARAAPPREGFFDITRIGR
jgi:hypothetical protein